MGAFHAPSTCVAGDSPRELRRLRFFSGAPTDWVCQTGAAGAAAGGGSVAGSTGTATGSGSATAAGRRNRIRERSRGGSLADLIESAVDRRRRLGADTSLSDPLDRTRAGVSRLASIGEAKGLPALIGSVETATGTSITAL
jgi:hypothetical protein